MIFHFLSLCVFISIQNIGPNIPLKACLDNANQPKFMTITIRKKNRF